MGFFVCGKASKATSFFSPAFDRRFLTVPDKVSTGVTSRGYGGQSVPDIRSNVTDLQDRMKKTMEFRFKRGQCSRLSGKQGMVPGQ